MFNQVADLLKYAIKTGHHQHLEALVKNVLPLHSQSDMAKLEEIIVGAAFDSNNPEIIRISQEIVDKNGGYGSDASYEILKKNLDKAFSYSNQGEEEIKFLQSDEFEKNLKTCKDRIENIVELILCRGLSQKSDFINNLSNNLIERALVVSGGKLNNKYNPRLSWSTYTTPLYTSKENTLKILRYSFSEGTDNLSSYGKLASKFFRRSKASFGTHEDVEFNVIVEEPLVEDEIPRMEEGNLIKDSSLISELLGNPDTPNWLPVPLYVRKGISKEVLMDYSIKKEHLEVHLSEKSYYMHVFSNRDIAVNNIVSPGILNNVNAPPGFEISTIKFSRLKEIVAHGVVDVSLFRDQDIKFRERFFIPKFPDRGFSYTKSITGIDELVDIAINRNIKLDMDNENNKKYIDNLISWIDLYENKYKNRTQHQEIENISISELRLASHLRRKITDKPIFVFSDSGIDEISSMPKDIISQYELFPFTRSLINEIGQSGFNKLADMGLTHVSKKDSPKTPEEAIKYASRKGGDQPHHIAALRLFPMGSYLELKLKEQDWDRLNCAFPEHRDKLISKVSPAVRRNLISSDFDL